MDKPRKVELFSVPVHRDTAGQLIAYEAEPNLGIDLQRVFVVWGDSGALRGQHAHKSLTQVLVCLRGSCQVSCEDLFGKHDFLIDDPATVLIVPKEVWSQQLYLEDNTILAVLCDGPFDETEYIRDYGEFVRLIGKKPPDPVGI